ncbi:MAG: hypothetical protein HYZ69_03530, partial [Candidatus Colwellbacteria bacterium]|nr:hypothetical protein [Candidatus Colwellbacteria bacterium]
YYEKAKKSYAKIYKKMGLGDSTYLTFASGGTFSKYSHEFQTLTPAGEDYIHICDKCAVAVNDEIISEQNACPNCGNKKLREEKAVEVGNIFKLKTKYSVPFGLRYKDEQGKEQDVIMGCYGIGLGRLMGTIVEVHHDDKGIIWPESVSPFKAHLIAVGNKKSFSKAEKFYKELHSRGIEVLYDDRDVSAGGKFAEADLMGIPYRLVVSDKTGAKIEVKKRKENKVELKNYGDLRKIL